MITQLLDEESIEGISANAIQSVVKYIQSIPELLTPLDIEIGYQHMGALLTDSILQAGLTYETTVLPRVRKVQAMPGSETTSGFLNILDEVGAASVLNWSHEEKPMRLLGFARFLQSEGVETTLDLRNWLENEENIAKLKQLRGIGNKTIDYLKILVGIPAIAIDRHLFQFIANANVIARDYKQAQAVLQLAANKLGISYQTLDHNIWVYMSSSKKEI